MAMRIVEALGVIAMVGLVLSHGAQFSNVIGFAGRDYAALVKGLQGG